MVDKTIGLFQLFIKTQLVRNSYKINLRLISKKYDWRRIRTMGKWISPYVEKEVLEVLRARVQYAILDQLNYMISNEIRTSEEAKKIIIHEITEITNESIELDLDEN